MTSQVRSQTLLNYMNGTKLATSGWRGTTQAFITNMTEQQRQYNALQETRDQLSDKMMVNMLNTSLSGTPHLQDVLTTYFTARKGAGIRDPYDITIDECVERLMSAAQSYDHSQTRSARRSANIHELDAGIDHEEEFDGMMDDRLPGLGQWEVLQHQQNDRHKTSNKPFYNKPNVPRKTYMKREQWKKLNQSDQEIWDRLTDEGKRVILDRMKDQDIKDPAKNNYSINGHQLSFLDDEVRDGANSIKGDDGNPKIEIGMHNLYKREIESQGHEIVPEDTVGLIPHHIAQRRVSEEKDQGLEDVEDLLYMATHKSTNSENRKAIVNHAVSQLSIQADTTRIAPEVTHQEPTQVRTKYELNMHSRSSELYDAEYEDSSDDESNRNRKCSNDYRPTYSRCQSGNRIT